MAHLFYDSPAYPWHIAEANELWRSLHVPIIHFGEIDHLRQVCGPGIRQFAEDAPDQMWRDMLNNVAIAGRLRELDRELRNRKLPHVINALDRLVAVASPDPVTWVLDGLIFANRTRLRAALAQLASAKTVKTVLIVRGERQSGKSWTKHFVEHYARLAGQGCSYLFEGMVTTVDEAVDYIFMELGGQAPPRMTTDAAWYSRVAQTMVKAAQQRNRGSWIIMDDLGKGPDGVPLVEPEIRKFFDQLALNMLNPAFAQWFKLVLIDYPNEPVPSKWRQCSLEDSTAAADMHAGAVSDFLCNWALRQNKTLSDSDAVGLAEGILQRAFAEPGPNDTRSTLQRVHDELDLVLGKL